MHAQSWASISKPKQEGGVGIMRVRAKCCRGCETVLEIMFFKKIMGTLDESQLP